MNVYSDSSHSALKYLKDTEVNVNNLLIMTGNFNIRDSLWDLSFSHHSSISDDLIIIADSFNMANDFIHLSQLGGLKFKSTIDVGMALIYIIYSGWVKNISTSTLAFNIAQFFPSLNCHLLTRILQKSDLDIHIVNFFANYLVDRKTNYLWNNFSFPTFEVNVGVSQGSALFPILLALYLSTFLYILENHLKNLNIPVSIISFMDDSLFISQNKLFDISNSHLFYSYNIMTKLLDKFGLIVEHSKTEVFHFNRLHGYFNPPSLNLSPIGGSILTPKSLWKYLGFIFNRKLSFY